MVEKNFKSDWYCVSCGEVLGGVYGNELIPVIEGYLIKTSGPNLALTCPRCGQVKIWYTSDAVVRAIYQLVNALSSVAAQAMIEQIGAEIHKKQ